MDLKLVEKNGKSYLTGSAGKKLMQAVDDATEVIGFCFDHQSDRLLLYAENFPENFFKLSSCAAGNILQKFRNYRIKIAAVLSPEMIKGKFAEMVAEENRGVSFHVFANAKDAEAWLLKD